MRPSSVPQVPAVNELLAERHKIGLFATLLASILTNEERVLKWHYAPPSAQGYLLKIFFPACSTPSRIWLFWLQGRTPITNLLNERGTGVAPPVGPYRGGRGSRWLHDRTRGAPH